MWVMRVMVQVVGVVDIVKDSGVMDFVKDSVVTVGVVDFVKDSGVTMAVVDFVKDSGVTVGAVDFVKDSGVTVVYFVVMMMIVMGVVMVKDRYYLILIRVGRQLNEMVLDIVEMASFVKRCAMVGPHVSIFLMVKMNLMDKGKGIVGKMEVVN